MRIRAVQGIEAIHHEERNTAGKTATVGIAAARLRYRLPALGLVLAAQIAAGGSGQ